MADSDAVRSRRKRMHAQGDHSLCRHDGVRPKIVLADADRPDPGDFDPVAAMRALADRLAEAYRQDPGNAALARELRATLLALPPPPEEPDWLDELRARRSERRDVVAELSQPVYDQDPRY